MDARSPASRSRLAVTFSFTLTAALGCGGHGAHAPGADGGGGAGAAAAGSDGATAGGGGGADADAATDGGAAEAPDDAGPTSTVAAAPAWRLTNTEYANTVHDLLGPWASFQTALERDGVIAGYRVGGEANENTALDYHAAAIELAAQAVTHLPDLVPCDPVVTGGAACAARFIDAFAPRAFRRPLDADRRASLLALYTQVSTPLGFTTGIQAVIERALQSPYFLYHLELEEQARGAGTFTVEGYSMASRLSYLLWGTMPDDVLFAKAAAGQLSTHDQIKAQAARMLEDPRARTGLRRFYEQWMQLPDYVPLKSGRYVNDYPPSVAAAVLASFDAQMDDALWRPQGSLAALFRGRTAYVNAQIASLFDRNDISGDALQPITLPTNDRAGILGHPAIMAAIATETMTRPVHRGEFVLDQVLCRPLLQPPPNEPPFSLVSTQSLRQQIEHFMAPAECQTCHASIDSMGFLFESLDPVGRHRYWDDFDKPVDTAVTLTGTGDPHLDGPTPDLATFGARLAANDALVAACLSSQLYRFASKRELVPADDATLADLVATFTSSGESIKSLLVALTQTDAFLLRRNEP